MAELLNILKQANSNLHFEREVIERRAEMASQCECLAMWVEGRECVCNKAVSVPLSTEKLKRANELVAEIARCENRLAEVQKIGKDSAVCEVEIEGLHCQHQSGQMYFVDERGYPKSRPQVTLPKAVLVAALKDEHIRLMIALQETGIVSVERDNIRVVPK